MSKFRRHIFYISGFDPRGARYYYTLYKKETARYAALAGQPAPTLSGRTSTAPHRVDWSAETDESSVSYTVLGWDDLIRDFWTQGWPHFLRESAQTYISYTLRHRVFDVLRLRPSVIILFYYPLLLVLTAVLATAAAVLLGGWVFILLLPALLLGFFAIFRHWHPSWLLRTFSFNRRLCTGQGQATEERCDLFARMIADTIATGGDDEILLVAHSSGTILLAMTLDRLVTMGVNTTKLKMITQGQFVQMVTLHRDGGAMRDALGRLSNIPNAWLDIGAPADAACMPLMGPFSKTASSPPNMTIASPRLHALYDRDKYTKMRRDKFNFHFLYLRCSDIIGAYNYPRITLDPVPLETHLQAIQQDMMDNA